MKRVSFAIGCAFLISEGLRVGAADKKCDRQCMVTIMDRYIAAPVKHNPSGVPLARNA